MTAGDYPEREYDDRVIEGVFDSPGNLGATGLRGLVEKATPSPWRHVPESDHFIVFASPEAAVHAAAYAETEDNARLIALAPSLALWAADAADALAYVDEWRDRVGIESPADLLARFAVIQNRAQEGTP